MCLSFTVAMGTKSVVDLEKLPCALRTSTLSTVFETSYLWGTGHVDTSTQSTIGGLVRVIWRPRPQGTRRSRPLLQFKSPKATSHCPFPNAQEVYETRSADASPQRAK